MTRDQFLEKNLTVVGKHTAIVGKDEAFIKKYLTQVGCPAEEKCTITWDATTNGGTCLVETSEVIKNSAIGELPTATKEGYYTFLGWFTAAEDGEQVTAETVITEDVTLYAQFESATPAVKRTVTLDATTNGGTCETASIEVEDASQIGELPEATKEGSVFDGWFTAAEDGDSVTSETIIVEDTTIYAQFHTEEPVEEPAE